jgi:hypothetical protein
MFADTLEELHAFALTIGMKRAWFQNKPELPHYDLTEGRRAIAIKKGAVSVDHRVMLKHVRANRERLAQGA